MPAENSVNKKHNILKTVLYFLLGLLLILTVGSYYLYKNGKPLLTHYLQKKVTKGSDSLYHIQFSDLDINLFAGHLRVKNLELIPDTAIYNKFIALKKAPDNLYRIKIKELDILNIAVATAIFKKKLQIDSVKINRPELAIISKSQLYNDTVKSENLQQFYPLIRKVFKQVDIKGIYLTSGNFAFVNKNSKEVKHIALNRVNIDVKEVFIDSLSEKDASRFYSSKSMVFKLSNYKLATPDSLYYLTVKDIYFSSQKRQVLFDRIAFTPRYNKVAFYQKVKLSKDRYDLKFNKVAINHIDLKKFVHQQQFFSSSVNISNGDIDVYNNNAYPEDNSEKLRWDNFPQQQLQKVAAELKIDTINLKNINVVYAEADRDSKQTGVISFNRLTGRIFNVTNDSLAKARNAYAIAKLHARLFDAADVNMVFKFNLTDKKGAFSYAANLGALNGALINQASVPLGMVKIKSALIQHLTFKAAADNYSASGEMKLYYKDLQIELLKKGEGEKNLQKKGLISALANTFIVKDDNPNKRGDLRIGLIRFNRTVKMPFFYYIWQSLFTGIKSSAGLSAEKDSMIDAASTQATTVFDKIKSFLGISPEKQNKRQERPQQKKTAGKQ